AAIASVMAPHRSRFPLVLRCELASDGRHRSRRILHGLGTNGPPKPPIRPLLRGLGHIPCLDRALLELAVQVPTNRERDCIRRPSLGFRAHLSPERVPM